MLEAWSWSRSLKTNARSQEGRLSSKAEREPPPSPLKDGTVFVCEIAATFSAFRSEQTAKVPEAACKESNVR